MLNSKGAQVFSARGGPRGALKYLDRGDFAPVASIDGNFYGGAPFFADRGFWPNGEEPPMSIEKSADGLIGWSTEVASITEFGNFPTTIDGQWGRVKVTPAVGNPIYSNTFFMKPSYNRFLNPVYATGGVLDHVIDPGTYLLNSLNSGGLWMTAVFRHPPAEDQSRSLFGLGPTSGSARFRVTQKGAFFSDGTTSATVTLADLDESLPKAFVITAHVKREGGNLILTVYRGLESATTTVAMPSNPDLSTWVRARIGATPGSTPLTDETLRTRAGIWTIATGTGDPFLFHRWVFNLGAWRNTEDYDFGSDAGITSVSNIVLHRKTTTTGVSMSHIVDTSGPLDSWTLAAGDFAWTTGAPPFIDPITKATAPTAAYISPAMGTTNEVYSLESGLPDTVFRPAITVNSLVHTGFAVGDMRCPAGSASLGDIRGTLVSGVFTCATPGTIVANMTYQGTTLNFTCMILPACNMPNPAQQRYKTEPAPDGNALTAGIGPYPTPVGTPQTFATAAELQTAINNLGAGQTLVVADCDFSATSITITGKDYGRAMVVAANPEGVKVRNFNCDGARKLTVRGFNIRDINGAGTHAMWFDHFRYRKFYLEGRDADADRSVRLTNGFSVTDGTANTCNFSGFTYVIAERMCHANDNGASNTDVWRFGSCDYVFFNRICISKPTGIRNVTGVHMDMLQGASPGPSGFTRGFLMNSFFYSKSEPGVTTAIQAYYFGDCTPRDFLIKNNISVTSSQHGFAFAPTKHNLRAMNNTTSSGMSFDNNADPLSVWITENVRGSGSFTRTLGTYANNVGPIGMSTVYPQYVAQAGSWRMFQEINPTYASVGAFGVIADWVAAAA